MTVSAAPITVAVYHPARRRVAGSDQRYSTSLVTLWCSGVRSAAGAVGEVGVPGLVGAVGAAVHLLVCFDAVSEDAVPRSAALWGHGLGGAFEAVEDGGAVSARDGEDCFVLVASGFAGSHRESSPRRWWRAWTVWSPRGPLVHRAGRRLRHLPEVVGGEGPRLVERISADRKRQTIHQGSTKVKTTLGNPMPVPVAAAESLNNLLGEQSDFDSSADHVGTPGISPNRQLQPRATVPQEATR